MASALLRRLDLRLQAATAGLSIAIAGMFVLAVRLFVFGMPLSIFRPDWGVAALLIAAVVAVVWCTPQSRRMRLLLGAMVFGLLFAAAFAELAKWFWIAELVCHFRVQLAMGLLATSLLCLTFRMWTSAGLTLSACAWQATYFAAYFSLSPAPQPTVESPKRMRILSANLLFSNKNYAEFRRMVAEHQPDVVAALEVTYDWQRELADFDRDFPFRKIISAPNECIQGVAVWSRTPILKADLQRSQPNDPPWLELQLEGQRRPITLVVAHASNPVYHEGAVKRNRQIKDLAGAVRKMEGDLVLVGDFNAAPWSPIVRDFVNRSGLRDARIGFGSQPSWPASLPGFRIPIDHCFVSAGVAVRGFFRPARFGSDHLAIAVDLDLPTR